MFDVFLRILGKVNEVGNPIRMSMNDTYANIDFTYKGEKYLLTIMKEEKKDESV